MARRRRVSPAPQTVVESFGQGIISDADASVLSNGQLTDCTDFMLDKPGVAYKRGGSVQVGGTCGAAGNIWVDVAELPNTGSVETLAWNTDLNLYRNVAGVWTSCGAFGTDTGYAPRMKPTVTVNTANASKGMVVWGAAAGNHVPRVYDGGGAAPRVINVATGLGVNQGGRYMVFYKGRLVLASSTFYENRMWFSPAIVPGPETAWDLTNSYIDFDHRITGLAALQNILLVFSRNHVIRVSGTAPPPGGNMSEGPLGEVGCTDSRSLVVWNDSAIWANPHGVFMSNGTAIADLTHEGGVKNLWKNMFASYNESSDQIVGTAFRQFYVVSVPGASVTLILDIPRRTWWKVIPNSGHANALAADPLNGENLYVSDGNARVTNWSPFWSPSSSYRTDAGGVAPAPSLTTRIINGGAVGLKAWRDGRLRHGLTSASSSPTATITAKQESDNATLSTTSIPKGSVRDRISFNVSGDTEGVQLTVTQTGACDTFELYSAELDFRPFPISRGGAA